MGRWLRRCLRFAVFDPTKTLRPSASAPKLNKVELFDLATCAFIAWHESILIHGHIGIGKRYLEQVWAREDLPLRLRATLGQHCQDARPSWWQARRRTLEQHLSSYTRQDLFVLHDFGTQGDAPSLPRVSTTPSMTRYE